MFSPFALKDYIYRENNFENKLELAIIKNKFGEDQSQGTMIPIVLTAEKVVCQKPVLDFC